MNDVNHEITREDEDIKLFKVFLYQSKIIIVDPNKQAQRRLKTILGELGAKLENIFTCSDYESAKSMITQVPPEILISEYYLPGGDAFNLFEIFKKARPDQNKCLSLMITSNSNQSYVAKAAEEEIDAFLIKPFRSDFIKQMLFDGTINKINPSEYLRMVNMGKRFILEGKLKEAKDILIEANKMVEDPTLALYYLGQIDILSSARSSADEKFKAGLEIHEVHFKSLESLFNNLMEEENIPEAYNVIKKMITFFPFNVERLNNVLKLSIVTENYADIENYYKVYKDSALEDLTLKKYISAALITMGKYYLNEKDSSKAQTAFQRSSSIICEPIFLRNIIESLCDYKLANNANYFFNLFSDEDKESEHYKICKFLINALSSKDLDSVVNEGKDLVFNEMVSNKMVFKFLEFYMKQNGSTDEIERLLQRKYEIYPDLKQ